MFSLLLFLPLRDRSRVRARLSGDTAIVLMLCLGPLLLAMMYGILTGSRLKSTWAFPFFNLAGIVLFQVIPTRIDRQVFRHFTLALAAVALLSAGVHVTYKTLSDRSKTAFDGGALARAVADQWKTEYPSPLRIVVANHMLAAIVSAYAPSRPSMLIRGDFSISPWLTDAELEAAGAAVVCPAQSSCFPQFAQGTAPKRQIEIQGQRFDYYFIPPKGGDRPQVYP
jgi:hypothetical protein